MSSTIPASRAARPDASTSISTPAPAQAAGVSYEGQRRLRQVTVRRHPDRTPLRVGPSRNLATHSRGFEWGYNGSGPAQLALALVLDYYGDADLALECYQLFCTRVVSELADGWTLSGQAIEAAVSEILTVLADE